LSDPPLSHFLLLPSYSNKNNNNNNNNNKEVDHQTNKSINPNDPLSLNYPPQSHLQQQQQQQQ
jgi:hypothetical protein